jgi:hypothetical protein
LNRSEQVESLVRKVYDLMRAGDGDGVGRLIGDDDGILVVGTDADEWWGSAPAARAAIKAQHDAAGGFELDGGDLHGYAVGDVGWFDDQPAMRLPDGTQLPMRVTGVARRAGSGWVLQQLHISVAASVNERLFG